SHQLTRSPSPGPRSIAAGRGAPPGRAWMSAGAKGFAPPRPTPTDSSSASWRRRRETVPPRLRSADRYLLGQQALCAQLVDWVVRVNDAHRARGGAKDHRLRVRVHVLVAHAVQQLT